MTTKRFTALCFLCVIMAFMCLSPASYARKKVKYFLNRDERTERVAIDWEELYPFEDGTVSRTQPAQETLMDFVKEKVEEYTSKGLIGYHRMVKVARTYDELIGWNMATAGSYNPVIKLSDGYLAGLTDSKDVSPAAQAVIDFSSFCEEEGIDFFYVNFPSKMCVSEDKAISGFIDYINQNADRFLRMLNEAGVRYYDFRRILHEEGLSHHEAFFRTDHHWKPEAGLWAAKHILQILRDDWGWNVEPSLLDPENFDRVVYPKWILGTQGEKLTLARTEREDFTLLYPKFETRLQYEIPELAKDLSGDFSVMYFMDRMENKNSAVYYTYGHDNYVAGTMRNSLRHDGKKLLILKDSFSRVVIPFLAAGLSTIDEIDLRVFSGSLKTYIKRTKPDLVMASYTSSAAGKANTTENGLCNFR